MSTLLTDRENDLFEDWSQELGSELFVRDGAVDPEAHESCCVKLLFVLKEVNDPGGGGWDLRCFLKGGGHASTWNNVARWVEGIETVVKRRRTHGDLADEVIPWETLVGRGRELKEERRKKWLRQIVVVNLKKTPGGGSTDYDELEKAVNRDRSRIEQQLSLYAPDYVIMCGSRISDLLVGAESKSKGIYQHDDKAWRRTARGIWYREIGTTPFIAYWHPQARLPAPLLHYGLIDAVRELADRRR